jgi:hypothetical protein
MTTDRAKKGFKLAEPAYECTHVVTGAATDVAALVLAGMLWRIPLWTRTQAYSHRSTTQG